MKNPAEWNESDLQTLITTRAEENINREFKRADALGDKSDPKRTEKCKVEISKDVSSFANSAGGIIVYGLEEEDKPPHEAKSLSQIDPHEFPKEWLDQVINSRIKPPIQGLRINPVALTSTLPGNFAYVVIIPRSSTAHQAYDKRYHKRYNFESVAMEDYEVRQAMNRAEKPTFNVEIQARTAPEAGKPKIKFRAVVQNTSELVGHEISAVLLMPDDLAESHFSYFQREEVGGLNYVKIPADELIATVGPFVAKRFNFSTNSVVVSDPPQARGFQAMVYVYDQFGKAAEAECRVTLFPDPGKVYDQTVRRREELY